MGRRALVTFVPGVVRVEVESGSTILSAAAAAGLVIPAPCGGRGACGRCAVRIEAGQPSPPSDAERAALARAKTDPAEVRLACMACVEGDLTVRVRGLGAGRHPGRIGATRAHGRAVAAVDLGTTTVSATLLDPGTGERLGTGRVGNRQAAYGADILSRVSCAIEGRGSELAGAAEASLIEAVEHACEDAGVVPSGFERIVVAANTAMLSLLAGAEVRGLASHPFSHALTTPILLHSVTLAGSYPGVDVLALPPVAAFVGGDLTAGLIAEGLLGGAPGVAYLDIGTNAEVAVVLEDVTYVASAPAGPAFEGWGIACGGVAGEGGITSFAAGEDGSWSPASQGEPSHLTGSGLLSAIAALRRSGHLDADGRLHPEGGPYADRFFLRDEGTAAFGVLGDALDRNVYLTQLDIRAFQYAKGAVAVALQSCCAAAGATGADIAEFVVAGSFGGGLAEEDLIETGVLPREAAGRVRHAADAALVGAAAVALDVRLLDDAAAFSRSARHIDLAADASFTERFVAHTRLAPFVLQRTLDGG